MEVHGKNCEEAWKNVMRHVFKEGKDFVDKDGRTCRELLNVVVVIKDAGDITKPIEMINSFRKWVYPSLEELESVMLSKKEIPGYYYNYGARNFNFNGINQMDDYIVPLLKKDKSTRRATIVFYDPSRDSSMHKKDIPGMICINFNVRDNKLNVTAVVRSNDLFFGWPANIYQTFVLQNYLAKKIGCKIGAITTMSISAHIFEDHFEYLAKIINQLVIVKLLVGETEIIFPVVGFNVTNAEWIVQPTKPVEFGIGRVAVAWLFWFSTFWLFCKRKI